jgi:hypothetical protein
MTSEKSVIVVGWSSIGVASEVEEHSIAATATNCSLLHLKLPCSAINCMVLPQKYIELFSIILALASCTKIADLIVIDFI